MKRTVISTELVRSVRATSPERATDYRDRRVPGFVLRARPTGAHSWRVQLPNRTWLSLGRVDEVTLADAREAAQTCRAKAALGEVLPKTKRSSNVSLRKFIDERYEPWMRATYGDRTRQAVRVRAVFSDFMDQPLSEITTARIDRWRSQRLRRSRRGTVPATAPRVAGATMNRDLAALQAALSRAVEWGYLTTNPVKRMKRSTEDERAIVRYLSEEEEVRLRTALENRDEGRRSARKSANDWRRSRDYKDLPEHGTYSDHLTPLVLLALNTGLRRGELFQLRWEDVSTRSGMLTVQGAGAKTGQTRHVPLNSEAVRVLALWKPEGASQHSIVFSGENDDEPLTTVNKSWAGLVHAAKVQAFRFHDLRHTFASKLVMAGIDLNTVRELLGHSQIAMTLRYAHLAPEHKAAAVERLVKPGVP